MKIGKRSLKKQPGRRVDELHRSPTRFELFRAWIERRPKVRLYIGLTALTWLSLTALIGIGPRPLIERVISQGIIDPRNRTRLESRPIPRVYDPLGDDTFDQRPRSYTYERRQGEPGQGGKADVEPDLRPPLDPGPEELEACRRAVELIDTPARLFLEASLPDFHGRSPP